MDALIRVGRLLAGSGAPPQARAEVAVREGRVRAVGGWGEFPVAGNAVREFPRATALPGFIDLHVHPCHPNEAGFQRSPQRPNRVAMMVDGFRYARDWLRQGVTTARVVGTPFDLDYGLRDLIAEESARGPRLLAAGRMLTMTGGRRTPWDFLKEEVTGAAEAARWTRSHLGGGADLVKLYCTTLLEDDVAGYLQRALAQPDDAPDPGRWGTFAVDEVRAICDEAHAVGKTVAAHVAPAFGIKLALRGGVDTIEHGSNLDDECIGLFLETGATLVPTLSVMHHQAVHGDGLGLPAVYTEFAKRRMEREADRVRRAHEAGVRITTGTDAILPGMTYATEIECLVACGLSPAAALRCATAGAAAALGAVGTEVGTLEPGKWADLVLLDGDPLADLGALRRVTAVCKAGEVVVNAGSDAADEEGLGG